MPNIINSYWIRRIRPGANVAIRNPTSFCPKWRIDAKYDAALRKNAVSLVVIKNSTAYFYTEASMPLFIN